MKNTKLDELIEKGKIQELAARLTRERWECNDITNTSEHQISDMHNESVSETCLQIADILYLLCLEIEKLPASTQQTKCSTMASDLRRILSGSGAKARSTPVDDDGSNPKSESPPAASELRKEGERLLDDLLAALRNSDNHYKVERLQEESGDEENYDTPQADTECFCVRCCAIRLALCLSADLKNTKVVSVEPEASSEVGDSVDSGLRKEDQQQYKAQEIVDLHEELIGPVENTRLSKTPWAMSLVGNLILRIANLRFNNSDLVARLNKAAEALTKLKMLGWQYRLDWSDFDGRTLSQEINDIADPVLCLSPDSVASTCTDSAAKPKSLSPEVAVQTEKETGSAQNTAHTDAATSGDR